MLKVFVFYDISSQQVNGVKSSYDEIADYYANNKNVSVDVIGPEYFEYLFKVCLSKEENIYNYFFIKECSVDKILNKDKSVKVHIATEGSIGRAVKKYCEKYGIMYTTAYHTMFPEYLYERSKFFKTFLKNIMYKYLKNFHKNSKCILTPSHDLQNLLLKNGFNNVKVWLPGVDTNHFHKIKNFDKFCFIKNNDFISNIDLRNINLLYVGRVTEEKNIGELLEFVKNNDGYNLIIIGHGTMLNHYKNLNIKNVYFAGMRSRNELVNFYNFADCFVFPSKTDTFGIVLLEALVCGINVVTFVGQSGAVSINSQMNMKVVKEINYLNNLNDLNLKKVVSENVDFSCFSKSKSYQFLLKAIDDNL